MQTIKEDKDIEKANEQNKKNALTVALLLLDKEKPTLMDLYKTICSLSYMGDSRKTFKAEDPRKIEKLASGSKAHFDKEYTAKTKLFTISDDGVLLINEKDLLKEIDNLPKTLHDKIISNVGHEKIDHADLPIIRETIVTYLTEIIKKSSMAQTWKGVKTTGLVKSLKYACAKLGKGMKKK